MSTNIFYGTVSADQAMDSAQGFLWSTFDRRTAGNGGTILVGGTIYYSLFVLMPGQTLGSLAVEVTVAGATNTLVRLAVINPTDSSIVAQTGDVKAAFTSTGVIANALGSPVSVSTPTAYYAAIIATGGTLPTLFRGNASSDTTRFGSNAYLSGRRTGASDITAVGPNSASGPAMWFAGISA